MPTDYCRICGLEGQGSENAGTLRHVRVTCARCGTFEWDPTAPWPQGTKDRKVKLSAFVREQNAVEIVPFLESELIQQVENRRPPRLRDRANLALTRIVAKVGYTLRSSYGICDIENLHHILAVSYSEDHADLNVILEILACDGFIKIYDTGSVDVTALNFSLTPAGLIQAEELSLPGTSYVQGFVAMSFDASMNDAYTHGFKRGIVDVGYRPLRIDQKDHINGISDEIITEIKRSRFLVADYTHMKNGVYFEAGVAVGLGIPVIATCKEEDFDNLHFDIKHINTLKWTTPTQLASDLAMRISGVIGVGPL